MPSSHLSLKRYYNFYNRKFFNSELPDVALVWEPLDRDAGLTTIIEGKPTKISLDTTLMSLTRQAKIVLLHEMIHVKYPRATHGKVFKSERQRLWDLGAFDKLI